MFSLFLRKKRLVELARKKKTYEQIIYLLEKSDEISKELLYAKSNIANQPSSYKIRLLDFIFPFLRILFPQQEIHRDTLVKKIKQGGYLNKLVVGTNELLNDLHKESLFAEYNELNKTKEDNFSSPSTLWERVLYFFGQRKFPLVDASDAHLDRIVKKATQHIVNVYKENTLTILEKKDLTNLKEKLKDEKNTLTAEKTQEILQTFYKKIFYKGFKQKIDHLEKIVKDTLPPETSSPKQIHELWCEEIKKLRDAILVTNDQGEPQFNADPGTQDVINFYTELLASPSQSQPLSTAEKKLNENKNNISIAFMSALFLKPSTFTCAPTLLEIIIDLDLASSICQGLKNNNTSDNAVHQWIAGYETLELDKHPRANAQKQARLKKTAHARCLSDIFELLRAYAPTLKKPTAIKTEDIEKYYHPSQKLDEKTQKEIKKTVRDLRSAPYKTEQALCKCLHAIMHKPENIIPTIVALREQTFLPELFKELQDRKSKFHSLDTTTRRQAEKPVLLPHLDPTCETILQQCFPILQIKEKTVTERLASVITDVTQKQLAQTFQNKLLRLEVIKEKILFIQDQENTQNIAKLDTDTFTPDKTIVAFWKEPSTIEEHACTEAQLDTLDSEIQRYTAEVFKKNVEKGVELRLDLNKIPPALYQELCDKAPSTTGVHQLLDSMHLNSLLRTILQKPTEVFNRQDTSNSSTDLSAYKETTPADPPTVSTQSPETKQMLTLLEAITQVFSIKKDREVPDSAALSRREQLSYGINLFSRLFHGLKVFIQCDSTLSTHDSQTSPSWPSSMNPQARAKKILEKIIHYSKDPNKLAQLLEHAETLTNLIDSLSFSESNDGWFRNFIRQKLFTFLLIPTKKTQKNNEHADQTFESLKPIIRALIAETQKPNKRRALAQIISKIISITTTTDATATTEANTDTNSVGARIKQYLMSEEGLENLSHLIPTFLKIAPTIRDFLNNKYTSHFKNSLLLKILVALSPETQQGAFKLTDEQKKQLSAESYKELYGKESVDCGPNGLELYELVDQILASQNNKANSEDTVPVTPQQADFLQLTAASKGLLCFLPFFFEKYNTYHHALIRLMQDTKTIVLDQAQQSQLKILHPTAHKAYQSLHSGDANALNTLLQPLDDQSKHSVYSSLFSCLDDTQQDILLQKSWQDTLQKFRKHIQDFEKTTEHDITAPIQGLIELLQSVKYTENPLIHRQAADVKQLNHLAPLLLFLLKPMLKHHGIDINDQTAHAIAESFTKEMLSNIVLRRQTPSTPHRLPTKQHRFSLTTVLSNLIFNSPIAKFLKWLISSFIILPLESLKPYFHTRRHQPKPPKAKIHFSTMPPPVVTTSKIHSSTMNHPEATTDASSGACTHAEATHSSGPKT